MKKWTALFPVANGFIVTFSEIMTDRQFVPMHPITNARKTPGRIRSGLSSATQKGSTKHQTTRRPSITFFLRSKRNVGENHTKIPPTAAHYLPPNRYVEHHFFYKDGQQSPIALDPNKTVARRAFSLWYDGASSLR
jgi:hypothetical protein